jgi:opacity protein-like surface antigen
MNKLVKIVAIILLLGFGACAQEVRHEFTVQGSGFFPKETTSDGITSKPTYSGGVMAGYRYNLKKWFAVEGNYDYFRNSQKFLGNSGAAYIGTNVHAVTGTGIVKLPTLQKFRPFVLAGGGAMVFDPHDSVGIDRQTRGAFVYGGGGDYPLVRHVALRAQYRGFFYKVPDFGTNQLKLDKYTHAAVPSAGLVVTF